MFFNPIDSGNCHACGDEHKLADMYELRCELVCAGCKGDHDMATERERAKEFRMLSADWYEAHGERFDGGYEDDSTYREGFCE